MTLTLGSYLGPYEITAIIGSGGMGEVYRARDHRLGRDIAIKVVSEATSGDPVMLSRFTQEAHAVAALNHPHIVTIYSTEEASGVRFMTMELIEGRTLARMIPDGGLSPAQFFDVSIAIADALAAAHQKHITHRDLTPANVMVTGQGQVKVLDFGLARGGEEAPDPVGIEEQATRPRLTGAGTILGTMPYMSPEQIEAKPLDQRTDIFSFGVVMYEMATGMRPFRAHTKPGLTASIMRDHPRPVAELRRDLPADVSRLIARCLEKDPRDRVQTAHEILLELRSVRRIWESGATAPTPGRRPGSRWPWAAALVLLGGLALLGLRGQRPAGPSPTTAAVVPLIVVLPIENVTRDPTDEVLADGLLDTVTNSLTQLERFPRTLRVVPANEVRRERVLTAREARRTFGAFLAITGSIQRLPSAAGLGRLTLNLIDAGATQAFQVASQTIDLTSAAVSQQAVMGAVASLLATQVQLPPEARRAMAAGGSEIANAYVQFNLGRGYLARFDRPENIDRAIESLTGAVTSDPRYALAHAALGEACYRKYQVTLQATWLDRAVEHAERALAIDNRLPSVHITLAQLARGRGRFEQALTFAQTAVELDPLSSDGYRELAGASEKLNRDADAEAAYRTAVRARNNDWLSYNMLGSFLYNRGRHAEARAAFEREMELAPDNIKALNNLGATYSALQRREDAAALWTRSMEIRPNSTAASNLGSYYYSLGRYADAARQYEQAVAIPPASFLVWGNLAAALYWSPGERSKAAPAYEKSIELAEASRRVNPRQVQVLASLADSYSVLRQRSKAREAIAAVERLEARDARTLFTVASALEQLGDRDEALRWMSKAVAAGYDRADIDRSPWLEALREDKRFVEILRKEKPQTNN